MTLSYNKFIKASQKKGETTRSTSVKSQYTTKGCHPLYQKKLQPLKVPVYARVKPQSLFVE